MKLSFKKYSAYRTRFYRVIFQLEAKSKKNIIDKYQYQFIDFKAASEQDALSQFEEYVNSDPLISSGSYNISDFDIWRIEDNSYIAPHDGFNHVAISAKYSDLYDNNQRLKIWSSEETNRILRGA